MDGERLTWTPRADSSLYKLHGVAMSLCKLLICQLGLCWLLLSAVVQADPLLSGIAVHKELGQEQFLGALYADVLSNDADVVLDERVAKRMELKILAREGIAPRRFTRMWIEGAAINIPTTTMSAQVENMLAFDQLFRGRLEQNDHLVFEFMPDKGIEVSLNSTRLGVIEDAEFFAVLLRSWIGRVPLSSGYRDELLQLGDVDSERLHRYTHMEPRLSRIAIAQTWLDAMVESDQGEPEPAPVAAANNKRPGAVSAAKALVEAPSKAPAISKPIQPVIAAPDLPALPKPATSIATASPAATTAPVQTDAQTPAATQPIAASPDTGVAGLGADDEPSQLTAQTLVAQQFYISDVMNRIYAKVVYPRRARELQQFGSVKMRVVIDAQGNITTLQPMEMSDYNLLNKAVESAIKKSAPFPPLPSNLAAQGLEFSVPIIFALGQS
jgi:TonB family protein